MADYPQELIPINGRAMKLTEAAVWYLRFKLLMETGEGAHRCPRCGEAVHFVGGKQSHGDVYKNWLAAKCPRCNISSDRCEYPAFTTSPVELANGAMSRALYEFERRARAGSPRWQDSPNAPSGAKVE